MIDAFNLDFTVLIDQAVGDFATVLSLLVGVALTLAAIFVVVRGATEFLGDYRELKYRRAWIAARGEDPATYDSWEYDNYYIRRGEDPDYADF